MKPSYATSHFCVFSSLPYCSLLRLLPLPGLHFPTCLFLLTLRASAENTISRDTFPYGLIPSSLSNSSVAFSFYLLLWLLTYTYSTLKRLEGKNHLLHFVVHLRAQSLASEDTQYLFQKVMCMKVVTEVSFEGRVGLRWRQRRGSRILR